MFIIWFRGQVICHFHLNFPWTFPGNMLCYAYIEVFDLQFQQELLMVIKYWNRSFNFRYYFHVAFYVYLWTFFFFFFLGKKDMDVNEDGIQSNFTLIKIKELLFYCWSTFHSQDIVFPQEWTQFIPKKKSLPKYTIKKFIILCRFFRKQF